MSKAPKRKEITIDTIADEIKMRMDKMKISETDLRDKDVSWQKINSVLRKNKVFRENYSISTFIEVLNAAGINLYFTND